MKPIEIMLVAVIAFVVLRLGWEYLAWRIESAREQDERDRDAEHEGHLK